MIKREWQKLVHNKIMLLVIIAVVAIPTIYTTLFLGSMWDPYGKVDQLPVAVVNEDREAAYEGETLNVGGELVDNLKDNDSLDFHFVDAQEAAEGLADGTYYMVITIPENFSEHAATLMDDEPMKMQLDYEVNPGTNYIASKMSESALEKIKNSIAQEVTKTYTEAVFDQIAEAGDGMKEAADGSGKLKDGAKELADGNQTITENLQKLADSTLTFRDGSDSLEVGLTEYVNGVNSVAEGAVSLADGAGKLADGTNTLADGSRSLADGAQTLSDGISSADDGAKKLADGTSSLKDGAASLKDGASRLSGGLNELEGKVPELADGVGKLQSGSAQVSGGAAALDQGMGTLAGGIQTVSQGASDLADGLTQLQEKTEAMSGTLVTQVSDMASQMAGMQQAIGELKAENEKLKEQIGAAGNGASQALAQLDQVTAGADTSAAGEQISELQGQLQSLSDAVNGLSFATSVSKDVEVSVDVPSASEDGEDGGSTETVTQTVHIEEAVDQPDLSGIKDQISGISSAAGALLGQLEAADHTGDQDALNAARSALENVVNTAGADTGSAEEAEAAESADVSGQLEAMKSSLEELKAGINTLRLGAVSLKEGIDGQLVSGAEELKKGTASLAAGASQLSAGTTQLGSQLPTLTDGVTRLAQGAKDLDSGAGTLLDGSKTLNSGAQDLADGTGQLKDGAGTLTAGIGTLQGGIGDLQSGAASLKAGTDTLVDGTGKLVANHEKLLDGADQLSDGAAQISDGAGQLRDGSSKLGEGIGQVYDGADELQSALEDGAQTVEDNKAQEVNIEMFSSPVEAQESKMTEVPNNGHAMAPYMMSVALWVGCLAFCLMYPLTKYYGDLKSGSSWWLAKASVLYLIAVLQAFVMVGCLHLLNGFTPQDVKKTLLVACAASVAFMSMMYFFNVTMGKVGSFLMLVFMVVQLAGSTGTYPIELSGDFVPSIHDYLPFTYTVTAFRRTIAGSGSIRQAMVVLGAVAVVFTLLTIVEFQIRAKRIKAGKRVAIEWLEEKGLA